MTADNYPYAKWRVRSTARELYKRASQVPRITGKTLRIMVAE